MPARAQAPVGADDFRAGTAGALARLCAAGEADPARDLAHGFCHGQLAAVAQLHGALTRADGPFRPFYCPPPEAPRMADVAARFAAWAAAEPRRGAEAAVDGLLRFAAETYPCATRGGRR
ncbi:Rap1a/Tai family immunity protein [Roseococcus sp. DSY-14]|uniref:Rap1a/Tai family immunity protein n=1 Tax=Roseococcus sp. DSY-14 TaxID=3369650 RepID=UPI00387AA7CD